MFPSQAKIDKWTTRIDAALQSGKPYPGEAKKLGGGLTWAGQRAFKRLGRAMLRPILHQERCAPAYPQPGPPVHACTTQVTHWRCGSRAHAGLTVVQRNPCPQDSRDSLLEEKAQTAIAPLL